MYIIRYRKAVPGDIPAIEQLFKEMVMSVTHSDRVAGYEDGYLDKFFGGRDVIYAAEENGRIVGYISVEIYPELAYLDDLSVEAKWRGKGVGTRLIALAERYAAEMDVPLVALHVDRSNTSARYLYQRLGYAVSEEEESRFRMTKHTRKE